jgi:hypothetical protein
MRWFNDWTAQDWENASHLLPGNSNDTAVTDARRYEASVNQAELRARIAAGLAPGEVVWLDSQVYRGDEG